MNSSLTDLTDSPEAGLRVAGTFFAIFALLHVIRLMTRTNIVVARHKVPMLSSLGAAAAGALLSAWLWKLSAEED